MEHVHAEFKPFRCYVQTKFFYDGDESAEPDAPLTKCVVFGVSSYQGHQPTFLVRNPNNGAVFPRIPIHALQHTQTLSAFVPRNELVYHNCPDYDVTVNVYSYLTGPIKAYVKTIKGGAAHLSMQDGEYGLTLDWYKDHLNLHLVALNSGHYALLPSHKVLFRPPNGVDILPPYRKLRGIWRVPTKDREKAKGLAGQLRLLQDRIEGGQDGDEAGQE